MDDKYVYLEEFYNYRDEFEFEYSDFDDSDDECLAFTTGMPCDATFCDCGTQLHDIGRRKGRAVTHTLRTNLRAIRVSRYSRMSCWIKLSDEPVDPSARLRRISVTDAHRKHAIHWHDGSYDKITAYTTGKYEMLYIQRVHPPLVGDKCLSSYYCVRCRNHTCHEGVRTSSLVKKARKHINRKQRIPRTAHFARGSVDHVLASIE